MSSISQNIVAAFRQQQRALVDQIDQLYATLNVGESYPELAGLDIEFVRTLILLRDLKKDIRKRAVSSFFEWDKINRAKGGGDIPIGTLFRLFLVKRPI